MMNTLLIYLLYIHLMYWTFHGTHVNGRPKAVTAVTMSRLALSSVHNNMYIHKMFQTLLYVTVLFTYRLITKSSITCQSFNV